MERQPLSHLFNRIQLLTPKYVEEVMLFVDFLISKQQNKHSHENHKRTKVLLSDIEPLSIPVNQVIISRSKMYDERI
jgi:hypothetical protein